MATVIFRGDSAAIVQVGTFTVTAYDAATTYKITINGKVVSVLGTTDANGTASALATALTNSTYPEFQEITWSVASAVITATAKTAGEPFTATSSVSGGTGTLGAYTAVTANSSPGDLSQVTNYSTGALPSASDTLIIENVSNVDIKDGLTALAGIALAQVWFRNWGGKVGRAQHNGLYWEYRATYMQLNATEVIFDCPNSQLARLDSLNVQTTYRQYAAGASAVPNLETVCWKGTHASNVVQADGGTLGIGVLAGETAVVATLNCGYITQKESDSVVRCGTGVTLTTINRIGGQLTIWTGCTTINSKDGAAALTIRGSGTITTINQYSGNITHMSSGTITTLTLGREIEFDASRNEVGFTITNAVNMYFNSKFTDPAKRVTMSGGYTPKGCTNIEVFVNRGPDTTSTAA